MLRLEEIQQRRLMLNDFLKATQARFNTDENFRRFLNMDNDTFQYKGQHPVSRATKREVRCDGLTKPKMYAGASVIEAGF